MTIKEALQTIADEFGPFDRDEFAIIEDIVTGVASSNYRDGWAAGYASALNDCDVEDIPSNDFQDYL